MNSIFIMNKMKFLKHTIFTCFCLTLSIFATAQSSPSGLLASNDISPKGIVEEEWSFFYDAENEIYYIDFETISLNLTQVKVVANNGHAVIADDVADLPVNTIYELNCSKLTNGKYTVELHSYTDILKKEVTIK